MAAHGAATTLRQLSQEAESENVRLAAARAVLDVTLGNRRGFDRVEGREVSRLARDMVELSIKRMPDDQIDIYLRDVEALRRMTHR